MDKALALDPNYALAWFSDGALNAASGTRRLPIWITKKRSHWIPALQSSL